MVILIVVAIVITWIILYNVKKDVDNLMKFKPHSIMIHDTEEIEDPMPPPRMQIIPFNSWNTL